MHILITNNAKIVLSDNEAARIKGNLISSPDARFCGIHEQFIQIAFIQGIYDLDFYIKQEADNLKPKGLRRCAKCGEILPRSEVCACKDKPELREQHLFKMIDNKKQLNDGL